MDDGDGRKGGQAEQKGYGDSEHRAGPLNGESIEAK